MALAYSKGMPLGTAAPDFSLPATDGQLYTLASFADATALVIVFSANHCPYAQACEGRLISMAKETKTRGVRFAFISSNDATRYPDDSFDAMAQRAALAAYPFPYLYDEAQTVAQAYGAACTPDIYVFDAQRKLTYNGRLDDNWKEPEKVTRHELRWAIDATLAGKACDFKIEPSMGCSIKWKT
jgi:peroxiredoxin